MKLTHLLLAALVALPLGLAGCDASGPDAASALQATPVTQSDTKAAGDKSNGPIQGPDTINLGATERYTMYEATEMRRKNLSGTARIRGVGDDGQIPPTAWIDLKGIATGNVQVRGYHPQYGWSYKTIVVVDPNEDPCPNGPNYPAGLTTLDFNEFTTYSATCANALVTTNGSGSLLITQQSTGVDALGRPTVSATVRATGAGTATIRGQLGSTQGAAKTVTINPPPPVCDTSITTEAGITGPKSIRAGGTATYSASGAIDMDRKNLSAQLTILAEYSDDEIPPTRYLDVRAGNTSGNAQIEADFGFGGGSAQRTITICPSKVATRM